MALSIDTYETYRDDLSNGAAFVSAGTSGASGSTYNAIKKGTATYAALLTQLNNFDIDASGSGEVVGFHIVHGESDAWNGTSRDAYYEYLIEWQDDYDTDAKAVTGQTADVPAIFSQPWDASMPTTSSEAMVLAHKLSPVHFLVGPRYFMPRSDGVHLTAAGYRLLGRYHAKAQRSILTTGDWSPLLPISIVRSGASVVATFPTASELQWDTTTVAEQTNYGFSYTDTNGTAVIDSVSITAFDQVTINLAAAPTGFGARLRYAANGNGQRGNLRNSDTLPDWCCHFVETVSVYTPPPEPPPTNPLVIRLAGEDRVVTSVRLGGFERTIAP